MTANIPTPDNDPSGARYSRQTVLARIGREGQDKLAASTVLVVGCGSLGGAQAEFLARAGVGRLLLADRDVVELCNLPTQILYDEQDAEQRLPKAEAAARRLRAVNSGIRIEPVIADVTATNAAELVGRADLVLDGTDNFETRYLINDAAVQAGKPWIYGGVLGTDGMVLAVHPGLGPCLRCLFEEPPDMGSAPTCSTFGVLNTAVAWVAALQATKAVKIITGAEHDGFFHTLDIWNGTVDAAIAERRVDCPCCGQRRFDFLDSKRGSSAAAVLCGRNAVQVTPERRLAPDFPRLQKNLAPLGAVKFNGIVLEFIAAGRRLTVFPDGRVLVSGTTDAAEARSLVAKYIGS
ncbi:MAG: ThiF family adenylyltransferase [Elusimicrobia bacterium]|nr:ThiF family adenylyltransferase [Elusimicrobiota bacterium]